MRLNWVWTASFRASFNNSGGFEFRKAEKHTQDNRIRVKQVMKLLGKGKGGSGKSGGNPNYPSTTGNKSGGNRGNIKK